MEYVDIPYKTFVVMFSGHIVKELRKMYGWTVTKAYNYLKSKFQYDEEIHRIMKKLVIEDAVRVVLNRNPQFVGL